MNPFQASANCCFQDIGFLARISPANTPEMSVSSLQPLVVIRNVSTVPLSVSNIAVSSPIATFTSGGTAIIR